jgi:hypothetical protein
MAIMKKSLLITLLLVFCLSLQAQKDIANVANPIHKSALAAKYAKQITIYPVPVRGNFFNVKYESFGFDKPKDVTSIKVTNIIGQEVFKEEYSNPQTITRVDLEDPIRGMYLVTIVFSDGIKVVKKIMVEPAE